VVNRCARFPATRYVGLAHAVRPPAGRWLSWSGATARPADAHVRRRRMPGGGRVRQAERVATAFAKLWRSVVVSREGGSRKVADAIHPRVCRHRVRVATRPLERFEPCNGCPGASVRRRARATAYERRSLSRPQRRGRGPVCVSAVDRAPNRYLPTSNPTLTFGLKTTHERACDCNLHASTTISEEPPERIAVGAILR
jgi:hypothetical protein